MVFALSHLRLLATHQSAIRKDDKALSVKSCYLYLGFVCLVILGLSLRAILFVQHQTVYNDTTKQGGLLL